MGKPTCPWTARVDAHFAGKNSVADEAEMRRHLLEGCATCHHRYTRQAMLAKIQPGALAPQDRLARGLGIGPRPRRWTGLFALIAACGAAAAFFLIPRNDPQRFQARGGGAGAAELRVFRVRPGAASEPMSGRLSASDELAFAYRNATGKRHLFVFGVDEHAHVYWFSPPWRSAQDVPAAPVTVGDGKFHEIEDAVGHRYDGKRLDIHALFTDRPWRVQELESEVARAPGHRPAFPGDVSLVRSVEVDR